MTGKIVQLKDGFGFIENARGKRYFFHRSALRNVKFDELSEGQEVSFEETDGPKGPRAEEVFAESN
jgi:CspA family cold shock protein